jgi:hypothetical protein
MLTLRARAVGCGPLQQARRGWGAVDRGRDGPSACGQLAAGRFLSDAKASATLARDKNFISTSMLQDAPLIPYTSSV